MGNSLRVTSGFLILMAVASTAAGYKKTQPDGATVIHNAVEASDIWSTGSVRLKLHVKFMEVKSGEIDAEYEKIWISPKQWRAQFTSEEFNEASIGGDGQVWESSTAQEKPLRVHEFERALAALSQMVVGEVKYTVREIPTKDNRTKLICTQVDDKHGFLVQDCVDPYTGLMVQVRDLAPEWVYTYSDYKPFAGKQFPRVIGVIEGSRAVAIAEVVELEALPSAEPQRFQPPAGVESYKACPQALGFPLGATGGKLVKHVDPRSRSPRQTHPIIHYSATVYAIVGRDGILHTPVLRSGDTYLGGDEILDAVRQWRYEPFLVCGNPVEMPTSITVNLN